MTCILGVVALGLQLCLGAESASTTTAPTILPAPCPTVQTWTKERQRALAAEIRAHPTDAATQQALAEWAGLRKQARRCRARN